MSGWDVQLLQDTPWIAAGGLLLAAWLAWLVAGRIGVRILARLAEASPTHWDDAMLQHRVPQRLAGMVPALVLLGGMAYVAGLPEFVRIVVRNVSLAWLAIAATLVVGGALDALNTLYERHDDGSETGKASLRERGRVRVEPGRSIALMPDDIHAVANLDATYTVNLSTEARNGLWKLRVTDAVAGGTGTLDSWTLTL